MRFDHATPDLGLVVATADGSLTLSHPTLGECYHSLSGASGEARCLYVESSGIRAAWDRTEPVAVLDVGLGLGYNASATLTSWFAAARPPDLNLVSLEIDAALVAALASGEAPWQTSWTEAARGMMQALRPDGNGYTAALTHPSGARALWRVVVGDAANADVPAAGGYDFVWQDPFSPGKNPPLWSAAWFAKVGEKVKPGAVLMTYSVARAVRDALGAAGWQAERIPTRESEKRHWLRAQYHLNSERAATVATTK